MLFRTYMGLDTATKGRDADGMSFDGQLFVSFRKRTVTNSPRCLERAVDIGAGFLGISVGLVSSPHPIRSLAALLLMGMRGQGEFWHA
jgi:hypothetical protein